MWKPAPDLRANARGGQKIGWHRLKPVIDPTTENLSYDLLTTKPADLKNLWDDLPRFLAQEVHHLSFAFKTHDAPRHQAGMFHRR